jgi:hypothetical protein
MARTGRPETPLRYRLLEKIVLGAKSGCWEWAGAAGPQGYGFIKHKDGAQLRAHRVAYELVYGPIPPGMFVCHHCDNPGCVRPSHLFLGTQRDNMADMVAKGRAARLSGERNGSAKLNAAAIDEIRKSNDTHDCLAARFSVSPSAIGLIRRRERWSHL